jgi:hypothetical protein
LLLEFAEVDGNLEIPDPINFKPEDYQKVMEKIEKGVQNTLQKIIKINEE